MAKIKVKKGGDYELHPEGSFLFKVMGNREEEYQGKPRLVWSMISTERMEDGCPFMLDYWTGYTFGEKSKLRPLLEACGIDPDQLDDEDEIDEDDINGQVVKGLVAHRKGSQGGTFANIVQVSARPKEGKAAEKASKRAPAPSEFADPFADE